MRLSLLCALAIPMAGQQQGAKVLFNDPTSGVSVTDPGATKRRAPVSRPPVPPPAGVKYWLVLDAPGGPVAVPGSRVFRSGDRVRLHLVPNTDGELTILQSQDGGPYSLLFPVQGKPAGVRAGMTQAFPSATGWFRFDERPGTIRLAVMIRAAKGGVAPPPLPPPAPPRTRAPETATKAPAPAPEPAAAQTAAATYEAEMQRQLDRLRGSKALLVEEESESAGAATYVVVDARQDSRVSPGVVALEITLSHRARN